MPTLPKPGALDHLGELYHNFSIFGVQNRQLQQFQINQKCKQPILTAYISHAIAKAQQRYDSPVSFIEMFCADAFFAMLASRLGATKSFAMDSNRDGWSGGAEQVAEQLGIDVTFLLDDVNNLPRHGKFDIVANIGGLYHVSNPEEILLSSYRAANKFLIVQTVVSMANNDKKYFQAPAPGWTGGCRYSRQSFEQLIKKHCFKIVDQHFNILEGNDRPEDRGSLYYLIEVK